MTDAHPRDRNIGTDQWRYGLYLTLAIVAVRIPFYLLYPFKTGQIGALMQLLDPALLREDLIGSILHLHAQPPLYNLLVGLLLKLVPASMLGGAFSLLHLILMVAIGRGIYALIVDRWLPPRTAAVAALFGTLSPVLLWAERSPGYLLPIAAALLWIAVGLYRFTLRGKRYYGMLALILITLVPLSRSFYHAVVWMLPLVAGFLWLAFRIDRRRFAVYLWTGVIGSALSLGWYAKNEVEHDQFTGSTWRGMNVAGVVSLTDSTRVRDLIESGELTPLAGIQRLSAPEVYTAYYHDTTATGVPALDAYRKSTGEINWNHHIYPRASREYQRNSLRLAAAEPAGAALGVVNQLYLYSSIFTYHLFNDCSEWWIPDFTRPSRGVWTVLTVYVIPPMIFIALLLSMTPLVRLVRRLFLREHPVISLRNPDSVTTIYIGLTILYTTVIACIAELGEGALMRAQVDPLILIALITHLRRPPQKNLTS